MFHLHLGPHHEQTLVHFDQMTAPVMLLRKNRQILGLAVAVHGIKDEVITERHFLTRPILKLLKEFGEMEDVKHDESGSYTLGDTYNYKTLKGVLILSTPAYAGFYEGWENASWSSRQLENAAYEHSPNGKGTVLAVLDKTHKYIHRCSPEDLQTIQQKQPPQEPASAASSASAPEKKED